MKKIVSMLLVAAMCCGLLMGCEGDGKFDLGKPYSIKTSDWECEVTVTGAERTDLLYGFSEELAESSEIVYLNINLNLIESNNGIPVGSLDVWNSIRVTDENGEEIKPFEYALPGDETSIIILDEGDSQDCTIPYAVEKNMRYLEVDMYQDTEFSNKIKVNID